MKNKRSLDDTLQESIVGQYRQAISRAETAEEEARRIKEEASSAANALTERVNNAEARARKAKTSLTQWQEAYHNLEEQLQEATKNSSHHRPRIASLWSGFNNWIRPPNSGIAEYLKWLAKIATVEIVGGAAIVGIIVGAYFGISDIVRKPDNDSVLSYQFYWPNLTQTERGFFPNSSNVPTDATIKWAMLNDIDNTVILNYTTSQNVALSIGANETEQGIDSIIDQLKPAIDVYAISTLGRQRLEQRGDLKSLAELIMAGGGVYQTNANGTTPVIDINTTAADLLRLFQNASYLFFQSPFSLSGGYDVEIQQGNNQPIYLQYLEPNANYAIFPQILELLGDK